MDRKYKREGEPTADFIPCVVFGRSAEFAEKWFQKGTKIGITGRIQTGSYTDREGRRVYTTEIVVEDQDFAESKKQEPPEAPDDFMDVPEDIDEVVPFS